MGLVLSVSCFSRFQWAVEPMLFWCWPIVCDAGPTLNQHWLRVCVCWLHNIQIIQYNIRSDPFRSSYKKLGCSAVRYSNKWKTLRKRLATKRSNFPPYKAGLCNKGSSVRYDPFPANKKHLFNIYTTSAQRLRRWSNIVYMLYRCFVFTGLLLSQDVNKLCRWLIANYYLDDFILNPQVKT